VTDLNVAPADPQASKAVAAPAKPRAPRRAPRDHFVPLYGGQIFEGAFARENTIHSFALYFMLLSKANVCGIQNFLPEHDHAVYENYMSPAEAVEAFNLLVEKRYVVYDSLRHIAFIRGHLKWDLRPLKNSKIFKSYVSHARTVNSPEIKKAMAISLAAHYGEESVAPTVQVLARELLDYLLGPDADAIIRGSTVSSAAEWGETSV